MYDLAEAIAGTDGDLRKFWEERELVPLSDPMLVAALSPSTWIDRVTAPVFVQAGARDPRTPIGQIERLVVDLRARKRVVEYMRTAQGHAIDDPAARAELLARTLRFLKTTCTRP
jgi:dipeptidyl aminopeptidase/acylaminoacyl peptidase